MSLTTAQELSSRRRTTARNMAALEKFAGELNPSIFQGQPATLVERAAIWARMRYDCELIFVPG